MINVLITGSSGFVGQNITKLLTQKGFKIHSLYRSVSTLADNTAGFSWDDLDNQKLGPINAIIHLAGKAHDLKNTSDANEYFEVNTALTKKLFDAFIKSTASTFIFMSSVKAVADMVDGILTEEVIPDPKTPYGQSKQQAEEYISGTVVPPGKRVFILRPCMIHGPGNKGNLNFLYKFVKKGIPYPLAAFDNKRSFLSVSNLNFIIEKLISDTTIAGGVYNMSDDEPLSTNEVVATIAKASDLKPRLWKLNPGLIRAMASIGDKLHLPLNSERLKKLTESYIVSNNKIKQALHVDHLPVSSREGLMVTIKSFSNG